jgi:hypothetical protein
MNVRLVRVHAASYTANRIGGVMVRVRFVLEQHAELDLYSARSLKQQSADRHVAPVGHIILIPSRPEFALSLSSSSH